MADLEAKLQGMAAGWSRLDGELQRLRARVVRLEEGRAEAQGAAADATPAPARTPEGRRIALEAAGLDLARAEEIVWRQAQAELERLEVRDLAVREGWFGTDRYRDEIRRLREGQIDLRAELGDDVYDRYLYAAGEDNRLRVDAIIPGSAAEGAGLIPGDLIETYDGAPIFDVPELRSATTGGERGEDVAVTVRRADGTRVQAWLPRGPLGVQLEPTRARPDA
jgi:S1-C subfamily serine protease